MHERDVNSLISIIVPVFHAERYLNKCINSIVCQTFSDIEIILVDDGSSDYCGEMCDEWAKKDSRIYVIHKENGGLSDARNVGIDAATGDYLMFIDSDDYIALEMAEKLYKTLINNKADLSVCNFIRVEKDGTPSSGQKQKLLTNGSSSGTDVLNIMLTSGAVSYVIMCNKLFKKDLFQNIRFPKGKIHEDEFVAHHLYGCCNRVACISDICYYYVQHEGSIMHERSLKARLHAQESLLDRLNYCEEKGFSKTLAMLFSDLVSKTAELYEHNEQFNVLKSEINELYQQVRNKAYLSRYLPYKQRILFYAFCLSPQVYNKLCAFIIASKKHTEYIQ